MSEQQPSMEQMQAAAERMHNQEVGQIIEVGRHEFGDARFDDASHTVAAALGERTKEFLAAARQFDTPHRLIDKLGNDPEALSRLSKLSTPRMLTELARMEAHQAPSGRVETGADPMWKGSSLRGRVSDANWDRTHGAELDDKAWSKEFDRRMSQRKRKL